MSEPYYVELRNGDLQVNQSHGGLPLEVIKKLVMALLEHDSKAQRCGLDSVGRD